MIAYVKSNIDFSTKDILEFEDYSFSEDIEFADKSNITILKKPNITDDDFVVCKDGNEVIFFGICEDFSSEKDSAYGLTLRQKECLFDRFIFVGNQSIMQTVGIEDFIASEIEANWTDSGDDMTDKTYIRVNCQTHTPIHATVDAENGVYNLKTFLGNAKEYYKVFLDFDVNEGSTLITDDGFDIVTDNGDKIYAEQNEGGRSILDIVIRVDDSVPLPIDVTVTDVADYSEVYNIDVLAKLLVKWFNTNTEQITNLAYYLRNDRTITTNAADPNRANGVIKSVYIEKETSDEVYQEVVNTFSTNKYEHKISFSLNRDSYIYPPAMYFVGRETSIKTKTGIKTSLITGMSHSSESTFISFVFGKLKVTLIDKLRSKT